MRSFRNLKVWWSFPRLHHIVPHAVVLDVGCGCAPNMRSNILADKFLLDDSERSQPLVIDERPFIMCDALHLPFKDKSVDYVICSHVAEHVEEPEVLLAELSRVATAGYIECPGRIREMFHGWDYHRWYVHVEGDHMVFAEKPAPLHDPELHEWSARHFETDPVFEQFFLDNMERLGLVTAYEWIGRVKSIVRRLPSSNWQRTSARLQTGGALTKDELSVQLKLANRRTLSGNERVKRRLAKIARRQSDPRAVARLRSMLCCPKCKGDLTDVSEGLSCTVCHANFPVVGNVYYLVPEQVVNWQPRLSMDVVPAH